MDFVHTSELVDAVIAVLKGSGATHIGGLPSEFWSEPYPLQYLEHGDLADYASIEPVMDACPWIYVRGLGITPSGEARGIGKTIITTEHLRIVHARLGPGDRNQCVNASGATERIMSRARERYAKQIGKALFNDPNRRLAVIDSATAGDKDDPAHRTEVSLTCDGGTATVWRVDFRAWDLGEERGADNSTEDVRGIREDGAPIWAIACDIDVIVRTTPT